MSHILFFVHGVGKHATNWAEASGGPIEALKEASRQYAYFRDRPLESRVEMAAIHYDPVFTQVIDDWQQNANAVNGLDASGQLQTALGWLADATEQQFWWSHVADVVLYKLSLPYRQLVRTYIINKLATRIEEEFDANRSATCSVLAHSLGTAVAHDCLHYLGTTTWGNVANPFHPRHWRFQHVFMLANTSRLLESSDPGMAGAYTSIVRPGRVEDPASYCGTYWNVRHEYDPVAVPRRFDAVGWNGYSLEVVSHYHDFNIHGFSHYLANPKVHVPILRKVVRRSAVTDDEFREALHPDNFPQFRIAQVDKARAHLVALAREKLEVGEDPGTRALVRMLLDVYKLLEEFRQ